MRTMIVILLLGIHSGCKESYDAVDKATSEATGYRAFKQSENAKDKIREAERKQKEYEKKMKSMVEKMNQ